MISLSVYKFKQIGSFLSILCGLIIIISEKEQIGYSFGTLRTPIIIAETF